MSVRVKKLSNEPIVIVSFLPRFDSIRDFVVANQSCADIMNSMDGVLYRIEDITRIQLTFPLLLTAISAATEEAKGSLRDPNVRTFLVSKQTNIANIACEAIKGEFYGNVDLKSFVILDDALDHIRSHL